MSVSITVVEIQHIGTFTDSGEQDICDIDGCSVNMVILLFSCRCVDREKDQMVEDKEIMLCGVQGVKKDSHAHSYWWWQN